MPKEISIRTIHKLLEQGIPWPEELGNRMSYSRLHDDDDGTKEGVVSVFILQDGDMCISIDQPQHTPLRFRTPIGGGGSPRVRNALVLLALAIKKDEEAEQKRKFKPQR